MNHLIFTGFAFMNIGILKKSDNTLDDKAKTHIFFSSSCFDVESVTRNNTEVEQSSDEELFLYGNMFSGDLGL